MSRGERAGLDVVLDVQTDKSCVCDSCILQRIEKSYKAQGDNKPMSQFANTIGVHALSTNVLISTP